VHVHYKNDTNALVIVFQIKLIAQYPGGTFGGINLDDIKVTKGAC
jgi:hypothetical protein